MGAHNAGAAAGPEAAARTERSSTAESPTPDLAHRPDPPYRPDPVPYRPDPVPYRPDPVPHRPDPPPVSSSPYRSGATYRPDGNYPPDPSYRPTPSRHSDDLARPEAGDLWSRTYPGAPPEVGVTSAARRTAVTVGSLAREALLGYPFPPPQSGAVGHLPGGQEPVPGQTVVLVGDDVEAWVRERLYGGRLPER